MTDRERFLAAMRRERTDYLPLDISLCPAQRAAFAERFPDVDFVEYIGAPMRSISAEYTGDTERFRPYHPAEIMDSCKLNCWGIAYKKGTVFHFDERLPSMDRLETLAEFEAFPLPNPETEFDWAKVARGIAAVHAAGYAAVCQMQDTLFHIAWQMRGMEAMFVDMLTQPELSQCLLARIAVVRRVMARKYAELGADVLFLGDDIATQRDMLMKPELWREQVKPYFTGIIAAAHTAKPDILIAYHSCGNVSAVLEDFIELGIDILNPIQPECMDPFAAKARTGDRLAYWGGIGTQSLLPFGTPAQVYADCMRLMNELGQNGGYVLCPAHVVEPEVPWSNIEAIVRASRDYNAQAQV